MCTKENLSHSANGLVESANGYENFLSYQACAFHLALDGCADVYARRHKQSWPQAQAIWLRAPKAA